MKFTTHPFKNDTLELTQTDLEQIANNKELTVSGMVIKLQEREPDVVLYRTIRMQHAPDHNFPNGIVDVGAWNPTNVRMVFDRETGELKEIGLML